MNGPVDAAMARRRSYLALGCVAVWLGAAALTRVVGIWPAIGGAAVGLGLGVGLLDRRMSLLLLSPSWMAIIVGSTVGVLMAAATYLLYPLAIGLLPRIETDAEALYAAFKAPSLVVASVALFPVILGEELVWRGAVQGWLVGRLGTWQGVGLAAAVYALAHVPIGSPTLVAVAFCCGIAWGTLRAMAASLLPTFVAHLLWDVLVLLWLPLNSP